MRVRCTSVLHPNNLGGIKRISASALGLRFNTVVRLSIVNTSGTSSIVGTGRVIVRAGS